MPEPAGKAAGSAPAPGVGELLLAAVPMARTLGIEFTGVTPRRAVARLPDQPALHNHVGGPHAGALFTLGESTSGAVVLAAFSEQLARAVPLAVRADITYLKLARGTSRPRRLSTVPPPRWLPSSMRDSAPSSP